MTKEDFVKMNKESHYNSLIKKDSENRKLIKKLQLEIHELKKQLHIQNTINQNEEIEKIVSEIIYGTRNANTLHELGVVNTKGIKDISKLINHKTKSN